MTKFSAIVCVDNKFGISKDGVIPWHISEDLKHFKQKTMFRNVIMGRKTFENIPSLPNRTVHVLSGNKDIDNILKIFEKTEEVFIAGGEKTYKLLQTITDKIYITVIEKDYKCDKFFPKIPYCFKMSECSERYYNAHENVFYRFLTYNKLDTECISRFQKNEWNFPEHQYLSICNNILKDCEPRMDRTGTGTLSSFGNKMSIDISENVPLLTTKRVAWKSCINELLWFLRGSTNVEELRKTGCNIWNGNTSNEYKKNVGLSHLLPEDCGPIYGFNWRHYGAEYIDCHTDYTGKGIDQIEYIINEIKSNPVSRRLILNGWDSTKILKGILPPCHLLAQFYVDGDKLSCQMYQRSADFFLGVPFNIFSYTVLTYIIAMKTGLKPHRLIMVFGDTHIYQNHIEQTVEQVNRSILSKPVLFLDDSIKNKDFDEITVDDFNIVGYFPHPSIKAIMSV